ncbi:MAG: GntR family transcriptional regulator [Syntrophomonadaceae bacterium]|nr:GntR family transcriptional regulator [Syntrophomonadaceae bacterium]MDD4550211.1 GntR family transcriptional regulator [Syntrophomonadaceae bacterium]
MRCSTHGTRKLLKRYREVIIIISIDLKNPKPIFEQVRDGLKNLIICGVLKTDEKIPSVRDMAQNLAINPNTIQKAYRELETEGYVYQVTGKGTFVASIVPGENYEKIEKLMKEVLELVRELIYLGVTKEEINAALDRL